MRRGATRGPRADAVRAVAALEILGIVLVDSFRGASPAPVDSRVPDESPSPLAGGLAHL